MRASTSRRLARRRWTRKGVITLTADAHDEAIRVLTQAGFKTVSDESLVIRLRDEPGALAKVAERFKDAGVNIQSLHIRGAQRRLQRGGAVCGRPSEGGDACG